MKNSIDIYSAPQINQEDYRFLLGKNGGNNLHVIAMNPSVATQNKWDQTVMKAFGLALINGYDGCIIMNLSPSRESKSTNLLDNIDPLYTEKNISSICDFILTSVNECIDILACWGDKIEENTDMICSLISIYDKLKLHEKYSLINWYCLKDVPSGNLLTNNGHPRHLSRLNQTSAPEDFPIEQYIEKMKTVCNSNT